MNVDGAQNLLDAAARAGVERVVFTSSVGAMGPAASPEYPRSEQHFLLDGDDGRGDFRYSRSKARGEQLALAAAKDGLDVVVVNGGFVDRPRRRGTASPPGRSRRPARHASFHRRRGCRLRGRDVAARSICWPSSTASPAALHPHDDDGNLPYPQVLRPRRRRRRPPPLDREGPVEALARALRWRVRCSCPACRSTTTSFAQALLVGTTPQPGREPGLHDARPLDEPGARSPVPGGRVSAALSVVRSPPGAG